MKAGWKTKTIGEVCDVVNGGTPKTGVAAYWGGPHQWITPAEMGKRSSPYIAQTERTISDDGLQNSSARLLQPRSVILSSRAPIGHLVINTEPMATNQGCKGLIPLDDIDHKFLFYYLTSIVPLLNDLGTGATFKELSGGKLKEVPIPVPPLPEQRRIVGTLDEAFDGIANAKTNSEKNLQNARALFDSHLQAVFTQRAKGWERAVPLSSVLSVQPRNGWSPPAEYQTGTGIPVLTLSAVTGFKYDGTRVKLSSAPTRDNAHYWLSKGELLITRSNTPELVGHVAIYDGTPARAICCDLIMKMQVNPMKALTRFVYFFLRSPAVRLYLTSRAQGASSTMKKIGKQVVQNIPIPLPSVTQQRSIAVALDALYAETQRLESIYRQKLAALDELKKSFLHQAFSGELIKASQKAVIIPFPTTISNITPNDLHAGILAMGYELHEKHGNQNNFGHVKAEKIAHMIEAYIGIDLGRNPIKDAAGPNDFQHLKKVESRARKAGFFDFQQVKGSAAYRVTKYRQFDSLIAKTRRALGDRTAAVDRLLELMLPMNKQQAEIFCTVYAAWNNLMLDQQPITDEQIVLEAREHWHSEKLKISRERFFDAIEWIRKKGLIPLGRGKKVGQRGYVG